ncbi:GNAT family N-acetyltransferase [Nocardiopsis sp. CNT312]|uniref:GNAT family N-acetyltransferase n=1 Tax=Nocardiopsis sp. CNT312 TaxID=1137268 RepID=UPI000490FC83|nr:GNAT family N-acetyltransferase [Nocardiopsis sp. CNT312]
MTTTDTGGTAAQDVRKLHYREAGTGDVPALVGLVNSCYRGDGSRQGWTTEAHLLDGQRVDEGGMAALLARDDTLVLVAESGGDLAACCELRRGAEDAYFGMFSVRPTVQGGGLGRRVLAEAERIAAREWGCPLMRMQVLRQRAELIAWYERRGYARTGRTFPFPYGDARFGLPKRPDLAFVELARDLGGESA